MQKTYFLLFLITFASCASEKQEKTTDKPTDSILSSSKNTDTTLSQNILPSKAENKPQVSPKTKPDTNSKTSVNPQNKPDESSLEKNLIDMGLIDIQSLDATIKIDVKYTTTDNFMKADAYGDLNKIFLQKEVAEMLAKAHIALKKEHPNYHFIVFDGARPFRVQQKMWEIVKGTDMAHYVARPDAKGSMHNYGCAVDLSIIDENGKELDMGTPFDYLGALAQTTTEAAYIKQGKLTKAQVENRLILRRAMESVGFSVLNREWWHFNAFADGVVLKKYKKIP